MNTNIILIILGEPHSTFSEILFKYFKSKVFKKEKKKDCSNRKSQIVIRTNE